MTESSPLPDGWIQTSLGELGRYLNGRAFKTSEWSRTGRPIIRIQDLTGSNNNPNYFDGEVADRHVVRPGDLLVSWSATLGAFIWAGPEAVLNQHIFKVESTIDRRLHYHLVRAKLHELMNDAHGSGMVHVTKGLFDALPVAIPESSDVQTTLRQLIDQADGLAGSAEDHLDGARKALARFRQVVLASACSGQLTVDWRDFHLDAEGVETALGRLLERRKLRRRRDSAPVDLPLPTLPASFVESTIGEVAVVLEYGTSQRAESDVAGIPVLRMGNIQDGALRLDDLKFCPVDSEIERLMLIDGDLLFNRTNSPELVGKSAVFHELEPMTFASYLIRVRFDPEVADPDFVCMWINSAWGRIWARHVKSDGVSQSNINGSKLAQMPLPLPPIAEQKEIVHRASSMLSAAGEVLAKVETAGRAVGRSSHALLAKAFRGELSTADRASP